MKSRIMFAIALLLATSAPALAADDLVTAKDPQSVLAALKTLGYVGTLKKLDDGSSSISVPISGSPTFIDFYDCAEDKTECYTLLFAYGMDLPDGTTLEKANEWNAEQIVGRVWLDRDRDPHLDYSLSTFDGISQDAFAQNVKLWDKKVGDVKDFFNF